MTKVKIYNYHYYGIRLDKPLFEILKKVMTWANKHSPTKWTMQKLFNLLVEINLPNNVSYELPDKQVELVRINIPYKINKEFMKQIKQRIKYLGDNYERIIIAKDEGN